MIVASDERMRRKRHPRRPRSELRDGDAQIERGRERGEQNRGAGRRRPVEREQRRFRPLVAVGRLRRFARVDRRRHDRIFAEHRAMQQRHLPRGRQQRTRRRPGAVAIRREGSADRR